MKGPSSAIVSAIPGRIRVRHPLLRQPGRHDALTTRLAAVDGLRVAGADVRIGSLLLLYDAASVDRADTETRVSEAVASVLGQEADSPEGDAAPSQQPAKDRAGNDNPLKWRINRAAKLGMLGSLTVSLAALGTSRRLHAGAGALFVALLAAHTAVHRKRLFQ